MPLFQYLVFCTSLKTHNECFTLTHIIKLLYYFVKADDSLFYLLVSKYIGAIIQCLLVLTESQVQQQIKNHQIIF
jgi:hypothetical protein